MLNIILPVHNALNYLKKTISSIKKNTYNEYELIIIDDASKKETRDYIYNLKLKAIKIFNPSQKWVNYNWNIGVAIASGEYIAILNSDIELSKDWDKKLIKDLDRATITFPYTDKYKDYINTYQEFINGICFMIKATDKDLFPIPSNIKHWFGDKYLALRSLSRLGSLFSDLEISHAVTKSGETVPTKIYLERIYADYEAFSELINERIPEVEKELIRINKTLDKQIKMPLTEKLMPAIKT